MDAGARRKTVELKEKNRSIRFVSSVFWKFFQNFDSSALTNHSEKDLKCFRRATTQNKWCWMLIIIIIHKQNCSYSDVYSRVFQNFYNSRFEVQKSEMFLMIDNIKWKICQVSKVTKNKKLFRKSNLHLLSITFWTIFSNRQNKRNIPKKSKTLLIFSYN